MGYTCSKCGRMVEVDTEYSGIRCPWCGNRIFIKQRPTVIKKVKAV